MRLVVTADDVGLLPGMTAGALAAAARSPSADGDAVDAAEGGVVTAVSVTSVGEAFDGAITALRRRPDIDVGAHLVLVGERPLSRPAEVRSLLGRDGKLLPGFGAFCARWARHGIDLAEVECELQRQLARLLSTGLRVLHVNSHQHVHALPRLFALVARLAAEHGIPFVRVPEEAMLPPPLLPRAVALHVLRSLARRDRRKLPSGMRGLDGTLGLPEAGRLDAAALERVLARSVAAGGTRELVCHPGSDAGALQAHYTSWRYRWEQERDALSQPGLRARLATRGIEITSFSALLDAGAASVPSTAPGASPGTP